MSCTGAFLYHNTTCTNDVTHSHFLYRTHFGSDHGPTIAYSTEKRRRGQVMAAGRGLGMRLHITHTKNKLMLKIKGNPSNFEQSFLGYP